MVIFYRLCQHDQSPMIVITMTGGVYKLSWGILATVGDIDISYQTSSTACITVI